eukprot:5594715-Alexandrium_andersonii.AAC.1
MAWLVRFSASLRKALAALWIAGTIRWKPRSCLWSSHRSIRSSAPSLWARMARQSLSASPLHCVTAAALDIRT